MKTALPATVIVVASVLQGQLTREQPTPRPILQNPSVTKAAVQNAIRNGVIIVGAKSFPKLVKTPGPGSAARVCCDLGETKMIHGEANISAALPKGTKKDVRESHESKYSAPSCWLILRANKTHAENLGPTSSTQDLVPSGFTFATAQTFATETQTLKDYVLKLDIPDVVKAELNLRLEEFAKNYSSYASSMTASHSTLVHRATLSGAGKFNGRTTYRAYYDVELTCCPPELTDGKAFESAMRVWIDATVSRYKNALKPATSGRG
jgi:hypothetical protein